MNDKWQIWSIEHGAWWMSNFEGYTQDRNKAGSYSYEEAINIVENANRYPKEKDIPNEAMIMIPKK